MPWNGASLAAGGPADGRGRGVGDGRLTADATGLGKTLGDAAGGGAVALGPGTALQAASRIASPAEATPQVR